MQGDAPRTIGPLVWLNMDQQALDAAYDQGRYAPNRDQVLGRYALNSERARAFLGEPGRVTYDPSAIERLDVFRTTREPAPVAIFVQGGGWRGGSAALYAFLAET